MLGQRQPSENFALFQPSFALVYRGLAPDADRRLISAILAKLLSWEADATDKALAQPPLHLANNPDRERVRKHQMALANRGCITSIESQWSYRGWVLDEALKARYEVAAEEAPEQAFSLLRFNPSPGQARLQLLAENCRHVTAQALNQHDILLQTTVDCGADLRLTIKDLKVQMGSAQCAVALGLFPQDGDHLSDLLDCLDERLQSDTANRKTNVAATCFGPERWLAGRSWLSWIQTNPLRSSPEEMSPQDVAEAQRHWPSYWNCPSPRPASERDTILKRWNHAQAQRHQALETLKIHCERLDQLPSLPTVVMQIHQLAQDSESSGEQLSGLVEQDPSLSARLLAMVNSSWFGLRARVESIEHALVVIGREELAHLALMISSEKVFRGLNSDSARALWRHSTHVAEIARELGRRIESGHASTLFTAGLLHDVGKIMLLSFEAPRMEHIHRCAQEYSLPCYEIEREIWGHDHADLGALMLKRWGLPSSLCHIVEQHHGPQRSDKNLSLNAALIALADHLAHRIDASEPCGDTLRLRQCQLDCLQVQFGDLTPESLDLLSEDLRESLRGPH